MGEFIDYSSDGNYKFERMTFSEDRDSSTKQEPKKPLKRRRVSNKSAEPPVSGSNIQKTTKEENSMTNKQGTANAAFDDVAAKTKKTGEKVAPSTAPAQEKTETTVTKEEAVETVTKEEETKVEKPAEEKKEETVEKTAEATETKTQDSGSTGEFQKMSFGDNKPTTTQPSKPAESAEPVNTPVEHTGPKVFVTLEEILKEGVAYTDIALILQKRKTTLHAPITINNFVTNYYMQDGRNIVCDIVCGGKIAVVRIVPDSQVKLEDMKSSCSMQGENFITYAGKFFGQL